MSTDDRDDLVGDVADALTLDQQVPWERCARLATGADREQIENLRVIERVLASRPAAGPASETVPATRLSGSALVRHAVHALIAIASLEVAATLLLLPWAWGDFSRARGGGRLHDDQAGRVGRRRRPVAVGRPRGHHLRLEIDAYDETIRCSSTPTSPSSAATRAHYSRMVSTTIARRGRWTTRGSPSP